MSLNIADIAGAWEECLLDAAAMMRVDVEYGREASPEVRTSGVREPPLASSKAITVEVEYDPDAKAFITYVKELHRMSRFGDSEAALDATAEMIRGYLQSMEAQHKRIPLPAPKSVDLKQLLRLR